jgi:myo-inositol-1(or 4)-monophosphatase
MNQESQWLSTAVEAVLHAGEMQMASFGQGIRIDKKGAIDLVTEVDVAVETWFRAFIHDRFPDHRILAEELQAGPQAGRADSPYCWIFDPIDGTTNYAHGLPIFCASLGLEIDGRIEVGAVFDPTRKELFTAERGKGAFLNGTRLQVSNATSLRDALLCTGFPYDVYLSAAEVVGLFSRFVEEGRAVRRLGSAALDLCYVAAGRLDGFWEGRLHPWDMAAGALLVEEAGGMISGYDGSTFHARLDDVVASNGVLHPAMLEVIARYQAAFHAKRSVGARPDVL